MIISALVANNQHDNTANFQSLEELQEESSTDPAPITRNNRPSVVGGNQHSPVAQQNSTLTQDSSISVAAPSTPGMYRLVEYKYFFQPPGGALVIF